MDWGEDTPARVAHRLPATHRAALARVVDGPFDCLTGGVPQGMMRALRSKGLVKSPDERHWTITARGLQVVALLAGAGRTLD